MIPSLFNLLILLCCCHLSWTKDKQMSNDAPLDRPDRFNAFDWALSKGVGAKTKENVVLSPISVKLALAMLYEGSRGNTSKQLEKALNIMPLARSFTAAKFSLILQSLQEANSGYDITIASKLFIDQVAKPKPEFEKKIDALYNATIEKINFKNTVEAVSKINTWAKAVTNGHIKHLVSEADTRESTVLLLLNAVYFKGLWQHQFPANETREDLFYKDNNSTVKVPIMKAVHSLKYTESEELNASILRLPYMGGKFAMYIVLPFQKNGLNHVIEAINPDKLRDLIPKMLAVPVQLRLPKFQFEFAASLATVLKQLGITDMFGSKADLSEIADGPKELVVSNVIQKAGISVNEQGSTAYATTVVDLTSKFGEHTIEFNATHPFLFFIEDETTDTIVFVGKVVDPAGPGNPQVEVLASEDLKDVADSQTTLLDQQTFSYFDIELAQSLNNIEQVNWITSPSSIKTVLGLVLEGSSGTTLQQLSHLLRLPSNKTLAQDRLRNFHAELQKESKNAIMNSLSRILVHKDLGVKPKYKSIATEKYGVDVEISDFSAPATVSKQINTWVNSVTQGLIPELLDPGLINTNTSLVLLNAIYFKGEWNVQFDPAATHLSCFYANANECQKTEFMKTVGFFKYGNVASLGARILELPYSDPRYSMVILLPIEKEGLQLTMRNLPFNSVFPILENLPFSEITVTLPKFSIEYSLDLMPLLEKLGATEMFSEKANLEDMLPQNKKASISSIIHKAKIIVNEMGTIATGATAVLAETLMSRQALQFKADHPFLFFIRDSRTGFLFEGVYSSPITAADQVEKLNSPIPLKAGQNDFGKRTGPQNLPYPRPPIVNKIQNKRVK